MATQQLEQLSQCPANDHHDRLLVDSRRRRRRRRRRQWEPSFSHVLSSGHLALRHPLALIQWRVHFAAQLHRRQPQRGLIDAFHGHRGCSVQHSADHHLNSGRRWPHHDAHHFSERRSELHGVIDNQHRLHVARLRAGTAGSQHLHHAFIHSNYLELYFWLHDLRRCWRQHYCDMDCLDAQENGKCCRRAPLSVEFSLSHDRAKPMRTAVLILPGD